MKKTEKWIALLAASALFLAACGGQEAPSGKSSADSAASVSAASAEAEVFPERSLDPDAPIPADPGTIALEEQQFPAQNLILALAEKMTVDEQDGDLYVKDGDGIWTMRFHPMGNLEKATLVSRITNYYISAGVEVYPDRSDAETTILGFPAHVYGTNIADGWISETDPWEVPAIDVVIDYKDTAVGSWSGLWIRLTSNDYENYSNIYDVLHLDSARAVLGNFRVIEGDAGNTLTAGGITATFPSRWQGNDQSPAGPFAAIREAGEQLGALYVMSSVPADPAQAVDMIGGEAFRRSAGGRDYIGGFRSVGSGDNPEVQLEMYSTFSDERSLLVKLSLFHADKDTLLEFAEREEFQSVLESIEIDPDGYVAPGAGKDAAGFERNERGILTKYTGQETDLVIPSSISGMDIVGIGMDVFQGSNITSVKLPDTLTFIDIGAFRDCASLETVEFPPTLTYIGTAAFEGCAALRDVTLPSSVSTVDTSAFDSAGTGSFTAQDGVRFGKNALESSGFDTIVIGKNCDLSDEGVFSGANASSVTLGDGVEAIGKYAFQGCRNLTDLVLPDSVRIFGENAFANNALININIPEGVEDIPANCFWGTQIDHIVVPASVKHIGTYAFNSNIVVLCNPAVELEKGAVMAQDLVLPTVYEPADAALHLEPEYVTAYSTIAIAMDASMAQMDAFDQYLLSVGQEDICWFGVDPSLLHYDMRNFTTDTWTLVKGEGCTGQICLPIYTQDTLNTEIVGEKALAGSEITGAVLHGDIYEIRSRVFDGCDSLKDIWITNQALRWVKDYADRMSADAFAGIPDSVTVHMPASFTAEEQASVEQFLKEKMGMPAGAVFDTFNLKEGPPAGAGTDAIAAAKPKADGAAAAKPKDDGAAADQPENDGAAAESAEGSEVSSGAEAGTEAVSPVGIYRLESIMGMSAAEFAQAAGRTEEEVRNAFRVELREDGSAAFIVDNGTVDCFWTLEGDQIILSAEGETETINGTLEGDLLTFPMQDMNLMFRKDA